MTTEQLTHPVPLGSLLASAKRLTSQTLKGKRSRNKVRVNAWQVDAWEMFNLVGEQRYLVTTLANRLSKARFYVGRVNGKDLTAAPEPIKDERINSILDAVGNSAAGRMQLVERMAINLYVAGDGWLVGIPSYLLGPDPAKNKPEGAISLDDFDWRFCSISEVSSKDDNTVQVQLGEDEKLNLNPDDIYLIRVWRPHPQKWWEADSATRASLPVLKELVGLTMHVSAQIDSRLAGAGIILVPATAQQALRAAANIPDDSDADPFTDALIEAMSTAIQDRGSAAAMVPLVVTLPDETVDKIKHISFSSPLDGAVPGLREESIRRLALGQDAPPEVLLGTAGMNHWGGWLVQEEVVTTHIEPPLALICDAMTTEYLWPVLEQMNVEDHESYVIWYDVSHLIVHPNRTTDALTLHERKAISDEALRRTVGFDEADAPANQDIDDQVADIVMEMFKGNPALISRPGLKVLMQVKAVLQGVEPEVYDQRKAAAEAAAQGETAPQAVDSTAPQPKAPEPAASPAAPQQPSAGQVPGTSGNPAPVG